MDLTKKNIGEVYQNVLELVKLGKSTNSILASLGLERNKFIHLLNKEQKRELRDERVVFAHKYRVEQYWDGTLEEIGGGFGGCSGSTYTIPKLQPFETPRDIRLKQDALAITWMGRPESKNGKILAEKRNIKIRIDKKKEKIDIVNNHLNILYRKMIVNKKNLLIGKEQLYKYTYGSKVMFLGGAYNLFSYSNKYYERVTATYIWGIIYNENNENPIFIIQHNAGFRADSYKKFFINLNEFNRLDKNRKYIHVFGDDLILINQ